VKDRFFESNFEDVADAFESASRDGTAFERRRRGRLVGLAMSRESPSRTSSPAFRVAA
jgi:hypothetical protein